LLGSKACLNAKVMLFLYDENPAWKEAVEASSLEEVLGRISWAYVEPMSLVPRQHMH